MKYALHILFLLTLATGSARPHDYDVVIVGGTPAGITAAIAAAREGKSCVVLERSGRIGGLPVNGLGATDIATRGATGGLFGRSIALNRAFYAERYGAYSPQVRDCSDGYRFEPSVAAETFAKMLAEAGPGRITVLTGRQFDAEARCVVMRGGRIREIRILDRASGREERYRGGVFIDATYEGDLGAAAGVPFRLGREGAAEYGEPCAGKIYRWWKHGPDAEGTTYEGDSTIQAYNYRLCLTDDPNNRLPIVRPQNYRREEFASLVDDVFEGRNTDVRFREADSAAVARNHRRIRDGKPTAMPGDAWGMAKIVSMTRLPNAKTDANNQHLALISTDLPEENQLWPTAGWAWRDRFAARLRDYTLGLLWFAQHDEALPEHFRAAALRWGLAADEYRDNDGFPRQVYVREGRRLEGCHFFTAHDALPVTEGARPPLHASSVTASHYALDSHAVRKREAGRIHLDGFFSHPTQPYTVPYGVMVPRVVANLLFPVAVSGSHVGFSTLRMEPCWMALGEAAGEAAALAIESRKNVRAIDIRELQERLLRHGAVLVYLRDLTPDDPDYAAVQRLALRGYFPEWNARLDEPLDEPTARLWSALSGRTVEADGRTSRREWLRRLTANEKETKRM
ncbi:MAG: FAD-dependent oxidoreductase [Alistipes senegalensis]|nr:FAD-dependent oxidoreductase [Bacteroides cellulosilyticus]MCM1351991.1 FAD-dependent oxidoreductase [Alistipes senegalensis]